MTNESPRTSEAMRVGVIDVGSNTIRLLVADAHNHKLSAVAESRAKSPLGEEIEHHGAVSPACIAAAADAVRRLLGAAHETRPDVIDIFLTAPGRQAANADQLIRALSEAAGWPVRVLTAEEEGCLSYAGAIAGTPVKLPSRIAVCDIGGGSTQISAGDPDQKPDSITSVAVGSARLTVRTSSFEEARAVAAAAFAKLAKPNVDLALAVGGTARATRCIVGPILDSKTLPEAARLVGSSEPETLTRQFGIDESRSRVLLGGVAILTAVHTLLGQQLRVGEGGIREGAVLAAGRCVFC
jgi:exopolyphosphatase / guanosine-5'-triphosphate,3'-diphosphate pyrophosphatase